MKKRKVDKAFWAGVAIVVAGCLAIVLVKTALRNWIIIRFGVRVFNLVPVAILVVQIVALISAFILGMPVLRARSRQKRQEQQRERILRDYAENPLNPDNIQKRLELLIQEEPSFGQIGSACLGYMRRMDSLQLRQGQLIKENKAVYLEKSIVAVDETEKSIFSSIQNIVNLCCVAGTLAGLNYEEADKYIKLNEKRLNDVQKLLDASAIMINQYASDDRNKLRSRSRVEDMTDTILESIKGE